MRQSPQRGSWILMAAGKMSRPAGETSMIKFKLMRIPLLLLPAWMAACGGGADETAPPAAGAAPPVDLVSRYVGQWVLSCQVTLAPGEDPSFPDGLSGDEVFTVTPVNEKTYTATRVESLYNNTTCSASTSYFEGASVSLSGEIAGSKGDASGQADQAILVRTDNGVVVKVLMQANASAMYLTRADEPGVLLDADGFPDRVDTTRAFTRRAS